MKIINSNSNCEKPIANEIKKNEPSFFSKAVSKIFNFFNIKRHIGTLVGKNLFKVTISPDQLKKNQELKNELICQKKAEKLEIYPNQKKTHEKLDGVILHPNTPSDKYILVFNGKNDCYENHIESLKKLAEDTGANVVTFDYRGIRASVGTLHSKKSVLKDGASVLNYLTQKKGIDPNNILFYGHSLGGGIAAEFHKEKNHPGALVSEASFSSLTSVVKNQGGILSRITSFVIRFSNWNFQAVAPFKDAKNKAIFFNKRDPLVRYSASLYREVKNTTEFKTVKVGHSPKKDPLSKIWDKIKKDKNLKKEFPHPHHRTMDRLKHLTDLHPRKGMEKDREALITEDKAAYNEQVGIFKNLLGIPLS